MKKLAIIISCIIFLSSCDRKDYINDLNTAPIIYKVGSSSPNIVDSTKISSSNIYEFKVEIQDKDENIDKLEFSILGGSGQFIDNYGGKIKEVQDINTGIHTLKFNTNNDISTQNFSVKVVDRFGEANSLNINLLVFDNLIPVANATTNRIAVNDPNEFKIDASTSFDQDASFGGAIVKYKYTINGAPIEMPTNFLNYIFPSSGNYDITVQVQDNDGAWSSIFSFVLNV